MYTFTDTYAEERNGQPKLGLEQLKAGTSFRRFLIGYLQTVNNLKLFKSHCQISVSFSWEYSYLSSYALFLNKPLSEPYMSIYI